MHRQTDRQADERWEDRWAGREASSLFLSHSPCRISVILEVFKVAGL
jgi:hypothetical protein